MNFKAIFIFYSLGISASLSLPSWSAAAAQREAFSEILTARLSRGPLSRLSERQLIAEKLGTFFGKKIVDLDTLQVFQDLSSNLTKDLAPLEKHLLSKGILSLDEVALLQSIYTPILYHSY